MNGNGEQYDKKLWECFTRGLCEGMGAALVTAIWMFFLMLLMFG